MRKSYRQVPEQPWPYYRGSGTLVLGRAVSAAFFRQVADVGEPGDFDSLDSYYKRVLEIDQEFKQRLANFPEPEEEMAFMEGGEAWGCESVLSVA